MWRSAWWSAATQPRAAGLDSSNAQLAPQPRLVSCGWCATAASANSSLTRKAIRVPLHGLPDAVVVAVAECLDLETLSILAHCCLDPKSPLLAVFQRRARLRILPDAARTWGLLHGDTDTNHQQLLIRHFAVADSYQLHVLDPIRNQVRGLVLDPHPYARLAELPLQCVALTRFPQLERLEIGFAPEYPIDLKRFAVCVPRLRYLTIKNAIHLTGSLAGMAELQSLTLVTTNANSLAIAVGLPKLTSLTLCVRPLVTYGGFDASSLASVPPLTNLVLRGYWARSPHKGLRKHLATLRTFSLIEHTHLCSEYPSWQQKWWVRWQSMTQLHTLRLGKHAYADLRPLLSLRQLHHLQIFVSSKAQHCRPLRELVTLRELQISNAWVCDIIGFLPLLHTLVCEHASRDRTRARLGRRPDERQADYVSAPQLHKLVLRGDFIVDDDDPVVERLLHSVVELEIWDVLSLDTILPSISRLQHLRRLAFIECTLVPSLDTYILSSSELLEELYVDKWSDPASSYVPPQFITRLPNLRVLGCYRSAGLATIAAHCPKLTHYLVPFHPADELLPFTLARLKVVSLSAAQSCDALRRERGLGRALPLLQTILHPIADCLWTPECPIAARLNERLSPGTMQIIEDVPSRIRLDVLWPAWRWNFVTTLSSYNSL